MTGLLNSLILLNESALTIEQIAGLVARIRNGDIPSEEEIRLAAQRNENFVETEIARIEQELMKLKKRA